MANHSEFVELANELLLEEGELITLQVLGSDSRDESKPWQGVEQTNVVREFRNVPSVFVPVIGKDLGIVVVDKELLKRSEQVAIVAPVAESLQDEITRIKDSDGTIWKVIWSQALRPANETIFYIFGLAR